VAVVAPVLPKNVLDLLSDNNVEMIEHDYKDFRLYPAENIGRLVSNARKDFVFKTVYEKWNRGYL